MNRLTKYFLIFLTANLLFAVIAAALFWNNWQKNETASIKSVKLGQKSLKIGKPFKVSSIIQTPWYRIVQGPITFAGSTDIEVIGEANISFHNADLKGSYWKLEVSLIAFKDGKYKDLELTAGLSPDKNGKQTDLKISLPEIDIKAQGIDKKQSIAIQEKLDDSVFKIAAPKVTEKPNYWIWITLAALLIFVLFWIFKSKKSTRIKVVSAWDEAQTALKSLQEDNQINDERFFVRLSDILRLYIEKRFNVPATEKTSEEFIIQVRNDNLLKEEHKRSLENFMSTADMVKFAKMSANSQQKQDCLVMAGSFVKETIPNPTEEAS